MGCVWEGQREREDWVLLGVYVLMKARLSQCVYRSAHIYSMCCLLPKDDVWCLHMLSPKHPQLYTCKHTHTLTKLQLFGACSRVDQRSNVQHNTKGKLSDLITRLLTHSAPLQLFTIKTIKRDHLNMEANTGKYWGCSAFNYASHTSKQRASSWYALHSDGIYQETLK